MTIVANETTTSDLSLLVELGCTEATPDHLHASLPSGGSVTRTLNLTNSGGAGSSFELSSRSASEPDQTIEIMLPGRAADGGRSDGRGRAYLVGAIEPRRQQLTIPVRQETISVLVLSPDGYVTSAPSNLVSDLNAFPDIEASLFDRPNLGGITVDDLLGYDVVVTTNNNRWVAAGADVAVGNALADYVDRGGRVILHNFALDAVFAAPQHFHLRGRYIEEGYAPMTLAPTDTLDPTTMVRLVPSHRIFDNVEFVNYGANFRSTGNTLTEGALILAEWQDGVPMLALNNHSVYINALYSHQGAQGHWGGDLNILVYNAVHELVGGPVQPAIWLSFEPESGTVSAESNHQVEVTFTALPEMAIGMYEADVVVTVNDGQGYFNITIPASLSISSAEDGIFQDRFEP